MCAGFHSIANFPSSPVTTSGSLLSQIVRNTFSVSSVPVNRRTSWLGSSPSPSAPSGAGAGDFAGAGGRSGGVRAPLPLSVADMFDASGSGTFAGDDSFDAWARAPAPAASPPSAGSIAPSQGAAFASALVVPHASRRARHAPRERICRSGVTGCARMSREPDKLYFVSSHIQPFSVTYCCE